MGHKANLQDSTPEQSNSIWNSPSYNVALILADLVAFLADIALLHCVVFFSAKNAAKLYTHHPTTPITRSIDFWLNPKVRNAAASIFV